MFGQMADAWSGAIIYEWIEETNNYGLIEYGPPTGSGVNEGSSVVQGFLPRSLYRVYANHLTDLHDKVHPLQSLQISPIYKVVGPLWIRLASLHQPMLQARRPQRLSVRLQHLEQPPGPWTQALPYPQWAKPLSQV